MITQGIWKVVKIIGHGRVLAALGNEQREFDVPKFVLMNGKYPSQLRIGWVDPVTGEGVFCKDKQK